MPRGQTCTPPSAFFLPHRPNGLHKPTLSCFLNRTEKFLLVCLFFFHSSPVFFFAAPCTGQHKRCPCSPAVSQPSPCKLLQEPLPPLGDTWHMSPCFSLHPQALSDLPRPLPSQCIFYYYFLATEEQRADTSVEIAAIMSCSRTPAQQCGLCHLIPTGLWDITAKHQLPLPIVAPIILAPASPELFKVLFGLEST